MKTLITFLGMFAMCQLGAMTPSEVTSLDEGKIYLSREQIEITETEILVNFAGNQLKTHHLFCDEKGLYCRVWDFPAWDNTCINGHKIWCWKCGGCNVRYCLVGRCKCVAWE